MCNAEPGELIALDSEVNGALIRRKNDFLLCLARGRAAFEWNPVVGEVDYTVRLNSADSAADGFVETKLSGKQAQSVLDIPPHRGAISLEILNVICPNQTEALNAYRILGFAKVARPDLGRIIRAPTNAVTAIVALTNTTNFLRTRSSTHPAIGVQRLLIPAAMEFDVMGMDFTTNRELAIATRKGEVWIIETPESDEVTPRMRLFARGLIQPGGLRVIDGVIYAMQGGELTRLRDTDQDGAADFQENLTQRWGFNGDHRAVAIGPAVDAEGFLYAFLGGNRCRWDAPFRGWSVRTDINGDEFEGIGAGFASPTGFAELGAKRDIFVAANRNDWHLAARLDHLRLGRFYGSPASTPWPRDEFEHPGKPVAPAVWFPEEVVKSVAGLATIPTNRCGPFNGQILVADDSGNQVLRVALEQVDGEWQGMVIPFLQNLNTTPKQMVFCQRNTLFVGGWRETASSVRKKDSGELFRVHWNEKEVFEIHSVRATSDGLEIHFTMPVAARTVGAFNSIGLRQFDYQQPRGDDRDKKAATSSKLISREIQYSDDRRILSLKIPGLREGFVTRIRLENFKSQSGMKLLHETCWYTLNRFNSKLK